MISFLPSMASYAVRVSNGSERLRPALDCLRIPAVESSLSLVLALAAGPDKVTKWQIVSPILFQAHGF